MVAMRLNPIPFLGLVVALSMSNPALADFKGLLGRVPNDANALVLIDVAGMINSPLGVREGWKAKVASAYERKPLAIPPDTSRMVMAAQIEPGNMGTVWAVSVMDVAKPLSLDSIVSDEGGYLDKFGSIPAAWSRVDAYFVQVSPSMFGAVWPANRQFASRWATRKSGESGNRLSAYLSNAALAAGTDTPVLMAMDLQDVTSASKVRRRLATETFASLEGKTQDFDAISQALGGIRGVTLRVAIGAEATGKGVVDFDGDVAVLASVAKPLLLEVLSRSGALVDDFEDWQVAARGKQISFEGKLSTESLRRLISVVDPPAPSGVGQAASGKPGGDQREAKISASQQYFKTVKEIVDKLQTKARGGRGGVLSDVATWINRDANEISRLPILNVDPDLAKFAVEVSARLNDAARAMTEGMVQIHGRATGTEEERAKVVREERAKTLNQAEEIFKGVKADMGKIGIELTNRYKVEF
ncbi:MAG: hypothetical protein KA354_20335 [Phycisphaerae bacterium]|nr:hypothetical protein [Phycisphaerae bacterium]